MLSPKANLKPPTDATTTPEQPQQASVGDSSATNDGNAYWNNASSDQDMVNRDSKELPPGMQQVLEDHSQIVEMMSQILASTNNNLPQNNLGSKEPRCDAEITLLACRICGEIVHTSKECHEQCHTMIGTTQLKNVPWPRITCSLCDVINHVPTGCKFYSTVQ
jgi:hypothetical protein